MTAPDGEREDIDALPLSLLEAPLDFILAEHDRHRRACNLLKRIARLGCVNRDQVLALEEFLAGDLARHHDDEDEILFPVLRKRALPEDELDEVLLRLEDDHRKSYPLVQDILTFLGSVPEGTERPVPSPVAAAILRYVAREQRHLAIENAVVMAIAQVRLTKSDLATMSRLMKVRRGQEG